MSADNAPRRARYTAHAPNRKGAPYRHTLELTEAPCYTAHAPNRKGAPYRHTLELTEAPHRHTLELTGAAAPAHARADRGRRTGTRSS